MIVKQAIEDFGNETSEDDDDTTACAKNTNNKTEQTKNQSGISEEKI